MKDLQKIIKEELHKYILESILNKEIKRELPKLNPNVPSKPTIDIEPRRGDTEDILMKIANSKIPRQKAGKDIYLPTYADKLRKSREMRAAMIARDKAESKPEIKAAIQDFKDRLARADTIDDVRKADEILKSFLKDIETDESFPPGQDQ